MLPLFVASILIPFGVLADDCAIVRNAWKAMGKPAVPATTDCCEMKGVDCSGLTVTKIDWSRQSLKGEIPESLGRLTQLTLLNLGRNELSGEIPSSLGKLTQLRILYNI